MYLPRQLISHLYTHLTQTHHPLSPPVLLLVALEPDALCACRILTALLKRDYIPHKIQPISGYGDLSRAGEDLVRPMRLSQGGSGGVVACLGVGGLVDLESMLGFEGGRTPDEGLDGVEVWVFDARRPWNLENVFGGLDAQKTQDTPGTVTVPGVDRGEVLRTYKPGKGGIIIFDDGDIEQDLGAEKEAYCALEMMPEVEDDGEDLDDSESEAGPGPDDISSSPPKKRKSWSDAEDDDESESEKENRPQQRRRSNSSSPIASFQTTPRKRVPLSSTGEQVSQRSSLPPSNQLSSPAPASSPPEASPRTLRKRLLRLKRQHDATLQAYYNLGTSYSEPISSLMYSLASELGRDDNDLLWLAIVGVSSGELYGRTHTGLSLSKSDTITSSSTPSGWKGNRGSRIRQLLRDEVRRLNPPELTETGREVVHGHSTDVIPTHARSPTDTSIRLSPEPRFLLIRHWSLYDSMLHSPYLSAKLHIWSDLGRRRLHKLLAKMGVSLTQCKQSYTHMDMELKKVLRDRLLHFAPIYGLEGLVPPASPSYGADMDGWGFVRFWGWKACLSAADVAVIIGAMLEMGQPSLTAAASPASPAADQAAEEAMTRFYAAYDALLAPTALTKNITLAQSLHRAILRTGTSLLQKRHIRHLRAFRLALVKDGPDVALFCHPGALTKLALWVAEAVGEVERENGKFKTGKGQSTPLVVGCLDESKGVYIIVGTGGGDGRAFGMSAAEKKHKEERKEKRRLARAEKEAAKEAKRREREDKDNDDEDEEESEDDNDGSDSSEDEDSDDEATPLSKMKGAGCNRFGNAFQEVVEETNARVRIDSFEHSVVEVKKEDLSGFLETLSMKTVIG